MSELNIVLMPRRAALLAGHANTVDVLVRVQAPEKPATLAPHKRPDLNLAIVLDRSGSMAGAPVDEAKKAARFVVDHLEPRDRCALVMYDGEAELLVPAVHPTDKARFYTAIDRIVSRGNTDLHKGWLTGADALARFATETAISRVVVLSDGNANAGITNVGEICAQAERLAATGVTTSTLGLGHQFNEQLMTDLARAGRGRAYYGETAADLMAPFREEFDLLNAIAARKVLLLLKPTAGINIQVLNNYPTDTQGRICLPDIAWGTEASVVLRLTVPAHMLTLAKMIDIMAATVSYSDLEGKPHAMRSDQLSLPIVDPVAYGAIAEEELVLRRVAEVEASRLQERAREAALRGDWEAVELLLREIRAFADQNPWVNEVLKVIEGLARQKDRMAFSKEARYASHSMSSKLSGIAESRELGGDADMPSYLSRKLRQGRKP